MMRPAVLCRTALCRATIAALLAALPALAPDALAQTGGQPGGRALAPGVKVEVAPAPGSGAAPAPGTPDDSALRYYARIGDVERLEAEIARLRALDPSWEPPKDLFAPQPVVAGVDESPFWALLSAGKLAEARAAIAEQRRKSPNWQPSQKLLQELDLAEGSGRLRSASETKRWQEVIDAAAAQPEAVTCSRLDNAWRLAEAYGELKQLDRAFETYRTIVTQCPKAKERRDTLFKASRYLGPERVRELAALGSTANPAPGEDYATVRAAEAELETGRLLQRLGDGKGSLSPAELARAEEIVREKQDADGAIALGWYFQGRRNYAQAQSWFAEANSWSPSDKAAEGLVLAYAGAGDKARAREAGAAWKGKSPRVDRALKAVEPPRGGTGGPAAPRGPSELDLALARRDFAGCLAAIQRMTARSGPTAELLQQRGWCLMELKRPSEAEIAFQEAQALAARQPAKGGASRFRGSPLESGATAAQENAYGQAVARLATGDTVGLTRDLARSDLTPAQRAEIRARLLGAEAGRALEDKRYHDVLRLLDARKELEPEPRDLGILRGWALYNLHRLEDAYKQFKAIDDRLSTEESREGVTITWKTIYHDW
ncbi:hypothetical protein [Azospirillum thermophilum]|uniref:Cellulose synthase n=1 Tax=Azospirillum thermophilum TaxID=2202148 RepID=A0A2S2CVI3_9PROT|nr:hypothetical protein [Azospirillum thermophilum]AWK88297.1 hypothetical protein DEW08_19580 [Azospirillum thermophilum]